MLTFLAMQLKIVQPLLKKGSLVRAKQNREEVELGVRDCVTVIVLWSRASRGVAST